MKKSEKERENLIKEVAKAYMEDRIKQARRRLVLLRILSWTIIAVFLGFLVKIFTLNTTELVGAVLVIAVAVGVYQVVRVLRAARNASLFLDSLQKALAESV